jgi:hypothetical protein
MNALGLNIDADDEESVSFKSPGFEAGEESGEAQDNDGGMGLEESA